MPLQIEVKTYGVRAGSDNTPGLTITLTLTVWPEGVVKEYPLRGDTVDMKNAVIFQDFSQYIKQGVEGKTTQELMTEAAKALKNAMQEVIDKYLTEDELLNSTRLEQGRAWIESNLDGGA